MNGQDNNKDHNITKNSRKKPGQEKNQKDKDKNLPQPGELKREFGRVVSHPGIHDGTPVISKKNVKVFDILDRIRDGKSDKQICKEFAKAGLNKDDINAARAYQARFLEDTIINAFKQADGERYFMLDENVTYMVLPDVIEMFGISSHVLADKLYNENNDDEEDIWAHVVAEGYKAVLTGDADFQLISYNYRQRMIAEYGSLNNCPEHIPAVIFVRTHMSKSNLKKLLQEYEHEIKRFIEKNHTDYAVLSPEVLEYKNFDIRSSKKHSPSQIRPAP